MASVSILQDLSLSARHKQSITLSDGRVLGFAEFGSLNDDATIVLAFHGWPGCRLESAVFHPSACELNVRIIGIDRPGLGLSSPRPSRKLLDWPVDVRELVRHLKLERYYILGVSAGGPHALACAHEPAEKELLGVGVVSGPGPWTLGTQGATLDLRVTLNIVAYAPCLARYFMNSQIVKPAQDPDPTKLEELMKSQMRNKPPADLEFLERYPNTVAILVAGVREGFKQGADPIVQDGQMLTSDWGFDPGKITLKNIRLWLARKTLMSLSRGGVILQSVSPMQS